MSSINGVIETLENCPLQEARKITSPNRYHFSIGFGYPIEGYDGINERMGSLNLTREPSRSGLKYKGKGFELTIARPNFRQTPVSWSHGSSPLFLLLGPEYSGVYEQFRQEIEDRGQS